MFLMHFRTRVPMSDSLLLQRDGLVARLRLNRAELHNAFDASLIASLTAALEAVGRGESLLDPAVTEKVLERVRRIATGGQTDELALLTSQEQKILMLVAEGKTNKEIAGDVFLSDKTVKNYVSSILSKLNLERRAQAAAFVAKHRIGRGSD